MTHVDSTLDDEWYENIIAAAKHLSLCNYYKCRSGSIHRLQHLSSDTTADLKTVKSEFVRNRGGTVIVELSPDKLYEVVVETSNGLTSLKPRKESR